MNIFRIEYHWYEDDYDSTLIGKDVEREVFEKDLKEAILFAESLKGKKIKDYDYLGKGYSVECLPEYYEQVIWYFIYKLGYTEIEYEDRYSYEIDEDYDETIKRQKIEAIKLINKTDRVII
jgi:hypothetical protein